MIFIGLSPGFDAVSSCFLFANFLNRKRSTLFLLADGLATVLNYPVGRLHGLTGSADGHRSIAPGLNPRPDYVRRVFHLSLPLVTFGGRSAHFVYLVHKSGRERATLNKFNHPPQENNKVQTTTTTSITTTTTTDIVCYCYHYQQQLGPEFIYLFIY